MKTKSKIIVLAAVTAILVGSFFAYSTHSGVQAAGTPDAVNDTTILYQDAGPTSINWMSNDSLNGNATLDAFDASSVNGGTVSDNGNGTFSYTPAASYNGGDGFTYTICNDDTPIAVCDTASVSITVVATTKCLTGFYQALSGQISIMDTTTNPATYEAISPNITNLNAAGFNANDGLIYGFSSTTGYIVSFNPKTGTFTDVYNAGAGSYNTGDMDNSNNLYYVAASNTTMHIYNTVSGIHSTLTLPSAIGAADMAYVPATGYFYGVRNPSAGIINLAIFNPAGPTVSTVATTGAITTETGSFGATWVTGNNTLYAYNNTSGKIFTVNTTTGASALVSTTAPNGNNDGMSCAAATSPFDITSILDYGDAPNTYGTTLASSGASAVVNTSYRLGNYTDIESDGQPTSNADGDDTTGLGSDEDGVTVGIRSLQNATLYESELTTLTVAVPLNAGYVSLWIDKDGNGSFGAGEKISSDVAPTAGTATLSFTLPTTVSNPLASFARVRLSARTGGAATGNYSFGEIEDYKITINPSRPTIANDILDDVTAANVSAYTVTGICSDNGDSVVVSVTDGAHTVNSAATTCSGGTFSRTLDLGTLTDGTILVRSTIDDGVNSAVTDNDAVTMDATAPTITLGVLSAVTNANQASYTASGSCTANGDTILVGISDGSHPAVTGSTTCSSGVFTKNLNVSGLNDGTLTITSAITDGVGNTANDADTVSKDTSTPTITNDALPTVNGSNQAAYVISGTCTTNGDTVNVSVTDGTHTVNATATTCSSGTFSRTVNLTSLDDGTITVTSSISDGVNPAVSDTDTMSKDSNLPTVTNNTLAAVSFSNKAAYAVSGTCTANGDSVVVSITDGVHAAITSASVACASGAFTRTLNLSGLNDGTLTVTSTITDASNNTVDDADTVTKDAILTAIVITTPLATVSIANAASFPVNGACTSIGNSITLTVTDGITPLTTHPACTDNGMGAGVFSTSLNLSSYAPGLLTINASITDTINPPATDSTTLTIPLDLDDDDTSSVVEMAGPNGGDGNNDGTPDFLQDEVTTKPNPIVGDYTTLAATGGCTQFKAVDFYRSSDLSTVDVGYNYVLGLNGFTIDCAAPGATVQITLYWDKEYDTSHWVYRKYLVNEHKYIDFSSNVTYGVATVGGRRVTTVDFSLTDGGPYDSDGVANGVIIDPAGPAVLAASTSTASTPHITAPNTGLNKLSDLPMYAAFLGGASILLAAAYVLKKDN